MEAEARWRAIATGTRTQDSLTAVRARLADMSRRARACVWIGVCLRVHVCVCARGCLSVCLYTIPEKCTAADGQVAL
jgi:hypothetical protein